MAEEGNTIFSTIRQKPNTDPGFIILIKVMLFGLIAISLVSWLISGYKNILLSFGFALIIACASAMAGGILGFLFGIPRSLQRSQSNGNQNDQNTSDNEKFGDNTNLEQISDWLTKIIVGVSLTQARTIQSEFAFTANSVANGFCAQDCQNLAYPFSCCLIIFFMVCGFLYSYLWARTRLKDAFSDALNKYVTLKIDERISSKENPLNQEIEAIKQAQLTRVKNTLSQTESSPDFKAMIAAAQPAPPTDYEDCQKDRWGGQTERNGKEIYVKSIVSNTTGDSYHLVIGVKALPNSTLDGKVYFMLHESYDPFIIPVDVNNGEAITEFDSYEAFTIGAVCDEGATKLELDLNIDPSIPAGYKYVP